MGTGSCMAMAMAYVMAAHPRQALHHGILYRPACAVRLHRALHMRQAGGRRRAHAVQELGHGRQQVLGRERTRLLAAVAVKDAKRAEGGDAACIPYTPCMPYIPYNVNGMACSRFTSHPYPKSPAAAQA